MTMRMSHQKKIVSFCLVQIVKDKTVVMTFRVSLLKSFDDGLQSKRVVFNYPKAIIV